MKLNIGGVDLFVMAHAWSAKGVAYFVSTCGTTVQHEKAYLSKYEDAYGNVQEKELPRPSIAHFLYEFLPLIDEHNKARQNCLALEKCWLTKCPWVRIITTFLGMAVVDLLRFDRNRRSTCGSGGVRSLLLDPDAEANQDECSERGDFDIRMLANLIGKPLVDGTCRYRDTEQQSPRENPVSAAAKAITRITNKADETHYPAKEGGRKRVIQQNCFICRQYSPSKVKTQWKCKKCDMPLCQKDRHSRKRKMTCIAEHLCSTDALIGCGFLKGRTFKLPDYLKKYKLTRALEKKKEAENERKRAASRRDFIPLSDKRNRKR